MFKIDRRLLQNVDWSLLAATFILFGMSIVTLAKLNVGRAGGGGAGRGGGRAGGREAAWFGVGMLALLAIASLDYRKLVRAAPAVYLLGLAGLVLVSMLGRSGAGARRWVGLGPVSAHPA